MGVGLAEPAGLDLTRQSRQFRLNLEFASEWRRAPGTDRCVTSFASTRQCTPVTA